MEFIVDHTQNVSEEELEADEVLQDSMMFRLIQISENARKLTDECKAGYETIPWGDVYGLRNRIVHDYGMVDLHIVYVTLVRDVPALLSNILEGHSDYVSSQKE